MKLATTAQTADPASLPHDVKKNDKIEQTGDPALLPHEKKEKDMNERTADPGLPYWYMRYGKKTASYPSEVKENDTSERTVSLYHYHVR